MKRPLALPVLFVLLAGCLGSDVPIRAENQSHASIDLHVVLAGPDEHAWDVTLPAGATQELGRIHAGAFRDDGYRVTATAGAFVQAEDLQLGNTYPRLTILVDDDGIAFERVVRN